MTVTLTGPIPGQSLTREPGNSPWEQPPKYTDVNKALAWHLSKFEDDEVLDDTMYLLGQGFPLSVFVESLTTMAVMEGYHNIDVSMLVAPIIHEYLLQIALSMDIKVVENQDPTPEERVKERDKQRFMMQLEDMFGASSSEAEEAIDTAMASEEAPPEMAEEAPPAMNKGGFIRRR